MTDLDREFRQALANGIDLERVRDGEDIGPPYGGTEWDCAAASALATCILRAPFHRRREVLATMLIGLARDRFFQLDDETL